MNSINSTSNITHNLKIKNSIPIEVGLDIGGSLTKMAVSIKKKFPDLVSSLKQNIEFLDEIQMEENIILIKLIQTVNFSSEGRDLLKSKITYQLNIFLQLYLNYRDQSNTSIRKYQCNRWRSLQILINH